MTILDNSKYSVQNDKEYILNNLKFVLDKFNPVLDRIYYKNNNYDLNVRVVNKPYIYELMNLLEENEVNVTSYEILPNSENDTYLYSLRFN